MNETLFHLQAALDNSGLFDNSAPATDTVDPASIISEEAAIRALRGGHKFGSTSMLSLDFGGELSPQEYQKEYAARASDEYTPVKTPRLAKLRTIHHQMAFMLAGGSKPVDVSRVLGMSASRVYILTEDPAFKELVDTYKSAIVKDTLDLKARAMALSTLAMDELQDRLLDSPEEMSPRLLLEIMNSSMDRAGYSPQAQAKGSGQEALLSEAQIDAIKRQVKGEAVSEVTTRGQKV